MNIRPAIEGQYRAGLAMLRECIEKCPDEVWSAGEHPRAFWRIAYHALYYTHLYALRGLEDFQPWERDVPHARVLWLDDEEGIPPVETTFRQADLLEYLSFIETHLGGWLDEVDFSSSESGFYWYKIPKLDHEILSVRHLGVHVGQLQERLYERGIDLDWVSRREA